MLIDFEPIHHLTLRAGGETPAKNPSGVESKTSCAGVISISFIRLNPSQQIASLSASFPKRRAWKKSWMLFMLINFLHWPQKKTPDWWILNPLGDPGDWVTSTSASIFYTTKGDNMTRRPATQNKTWAFHVDCFNNSQAMVFTSNRNSFLLKLFWMKYISM